MKYKFTSFGQWYCEYKNHVRIYDYFSIMINNFPILVFRRYDWDLHSKFNSSTYSFGIFGFDFNKLVTNFKKLCQK